MVYETRDLEFVNEAIEEVETGEVDARLVFDLGSGRAIQHGEGVLTEERGQPAEQPMGEARRAPMSLPS